MNSEKIILPDFLLADLYKDSLVVIDNEIHAPKKRNNRQDTATKEELILVNPVATKNTDAAVDKPLAYLGNNKKNISIVVSDPIAIHLDDTSLEILSAILSACKLNLADVAIINKYNQEVNNVILKKETTPAVVLLFGVETASIGLPFSIPDYKVQQFDHCSYIQSASLTKMTGSSTAAKLEKSKLWVCLKNLFGI